MAGQAGQAIPFDADSGLPIAETEVPQALAEGRAAFRQDAEVYMRDPATGRSVVLPAANAARALADGYSIIPAAEVAEKLSAKAKQAEFGGVGQQALTAVEGVASGVSFGLSDQALTGLGADTAERAEVNPGLRTGSEVLGAAGSLFIPGGLAVRGTGAAARAGQAARIATAAPRALARGAEALGARVTAKAGGGVLAKALGAGTAAAAEGAAYGAGQVISRAALQDQELTAEMLLEGIGSGALTGGLLGGGLGALGAGVSKAGGALQKRLGGAEGGLKAFSNREAALAMLGGDKTGLGKVLRRGGTDRLERLGARANLDQELMRNPTKALEVVSRETADSVARLKKVQSQMDEAGTRIKRADLSSKIDEQIARAGTGLTGDAVAVGKGLIDQLKPIRTRLADDAAGELTFSEAWDMRRALDDVINYDARNPTMLGAALKETRDAVSSKLDEAAESLSPDLKTAWKKANADYSDMATIRDVMKRRVEKDLGKSLVQSGDSLSAAAGVVSGLATGSTLTGLATGALLGGANRLIRERGHEFLARAANRLSKSSEILDGAARKITGSKLPGPARLVAPVAVPLMERYERAREETIALQSPQAMQARLAASTQGLEHEPGLVTAIHAGIAADAAYLQSQLPQERQRNTMTPGAGTVPPRPGEAKAFVAKAEALQDPTSVLADVADGKLDLDAIEALKVRRPKMYAEMRKKVIVYASQRKEQMPYKQRVLLSMAFDFAADPSLEPATMAGIQSTYETQPVPSGTTGIQQGFAQQDAQKQAPAPAQGGKGMEKSNQAMMLPSERAAQGM